MAQCPFKKLGRKIKRDLEKVGKDIDNGFKKAGKRMATGGTQLLGALPPLDRVRIPSKNEIERVFKTIQSGLQRGSDTLIDGIFDSSREIAVTFVPDADLSELDKAQEDAKDAIDAAITAVLNVISDEIKLIASIGEKLLKVYQLVRENKWEEAGELLAQALKDSVIALIPVTLRTALELVKKHIDKVLELLKVLAVHMGTLAKQSLQYNPITMLVRAIDSKAADEMDNAIGGAVDGVVRIVTDTIDAGGAVLKAPATIINAFKEGDFEGAGLATANGLMNAVMVGGTVAGGFAITALAGAAGGVAGRYTSAQNATWVEFGLGFISPGKAPKNIYRVAGGASDELATAGGRNGARSNGAGSRTDNTNSPNRMKPGDAGPTNKQMPVQPKLEKPVVKKPDEESLADEIGDVASPKIETPNGAEAVNAAKKKKVKLDTNRNANKAHEADKAETAKAADEAKKKKDAEEDSGIDAMDALDVAVMAGSMALVGASAAANAAAVAAAALQASQHLATQLALSKIAEEATTQAAMLKLNNDLHDSNASFMKGIGSSVKAAAQ